MVLNFQNVQNNKQVTYNNPQQHLHQLCMLITLNGIQVLLNLKLQHI